MTYDGDGNLMYELDYNLEAVADATTTATTTSSTPTRAGMSDGRIKMHLFNNRQHTGLIYYQFFIVKS